MSRFFKNRLPLPVWRNRYKSLLGKDVETIVSAFALNFSHSNLFPASSARFQTFPHSRTQIVAIQY